MSTANISSARRALSTSGGAALALLVLSLLSSCQPAALTVGYDGNGGATVSGESSYDAVFSMDASILAAVNTFFREGYSFTSWNTDSEGNGTAYEPGEVLPTGSDSPFLGGLTCVLYAQWEPLDAALADESVASRVKYRYVDDGSGGMSVQEEWSYTFTSGLPALDYYAAYGYGAARDTTDIYADEAATTLVARYVYDRDSNGDLVQGIWTDGDGAVVEWWSSGYNAQHGYLTFTHYEGAGTGTVKENRVCQYGTDGIHYTEECFFYGAGTDQATDLKEKYVLSYRNGDPTTGLYETETHTTVIRTSEPVYTTNPITGELMLETPAQTYTNVMSYRYAWAGSAYVYEQTAIASDGAIFDRITFDYGLYGGEWKRTRRMYLLGGDPQDSDSYFYDVAGRMVGHEHFSWISAKTMTYAVKYDYYSSTAGSFCEETTYQYSGTKSLQAAQRVLPSTARALPKFRIVASEGGR